MSLDEIFELIPYLGNLYPDSQFTLGKNRNNELDNLLKLYFKGDYNVTQILKDVRM